MVFHQLVPTQQELWLLCVASCHSEATQKRECLAWAWDICSHLSCTFSCLPCIQSLHQHPSFTDLTDVTNINSKILFFYHFFLLLTNMKTWFSDPLRVLFEFLKYEIPSLLVQIDKEQQNLHSWHFRLSLLKIHYYSYCVTKRSQLKDFGCL